MNQNVLHLARLAVATALAICLVSTGHSSGLDDLVTAAKQETKSGMFLMAITQPNDEATKTALFAAFQRRFGINVEWEWEYQQSSYYLRVIAEATAGRRTPDVISGTPQIMFSLDRAGLLEKFDWEKYAPEMPGLEDAFDHAINDLRGKSLRHFDIIYTLVYNTSMLSLKTIPRTLEELTDPKWAKKLAVVNSGTPFANLAGTIGRDKALDLVQRLKANHPVFKGGTPAVVAAVVSGEVPLAFGYTNGADSAKAQGAPVDWAPLTDYLPIQEDNLAVLKSAQKPNLGRLFAAWVVSNEAMEIQEKMAYMTRVTLQGTATWQRLREMSPNAAIVDSTSEKEANAVNQMQTEMTKLFAQ